MIIHRMGQGTDEWKAIRLGKFTASRFRHLFCGADTVTYKKAIYGVAYERFTGKTYDTYVDEDMQRGTQLEPTARESYEEQQFQIVEQVGFIEMNEYVGCSPDGLINEVGLLEIKCPTWNTQIDYLMNKCLPSNYKWQVQGQLWIGEREWCDFYSYHPELPAFLLRVYRDEKLIKDLETKVENSIEEMLNVLQTLEETK